MFFDYAEYMIRLWKVALLEVLKKPVEIDNLLKLMTAVLSTTNCSHNFPVANSQTIKWSRICWELLTAGQIEHLLLVLIIFTLILIFKETQFWYQDFEVQN